MGEGTEPKPESLDDLGPLVREKPLDLRFKVLEQRLTIKMIVGFTAAGSLSHLSIPSSLTVGAIGAAALVVGKAVLTRLSF